jgi:hypothetical protein
VKKGNSHHPIAFVEMFHPLGFGDEQQGPDGDLAHFDYRSFLTIPVHLSLAGSEYSVFRDWERNASVDPVDSVRVHIVLELKVLWSLQGPRHSSSG